MRKVESPADARAIQAAGKALLLLSVPGCSDGQFVRERLERVAGRNSSLVVAVADMSRVPGLAQALHITTSPTVVLFRRGQRISDLPGRATAQQLQDLVDSVLW